MSTDIEVQYASEEPQLPSEAQIKNWVETSLQRYSQRFSLCIRIVDSDESQNLNNQYRGKDKPTNVLSFSFDMPECVDAETEILGDLVVCASIVADEAKEQNKALFDHWAHMIVHGVLHLLGFDHIKDSEALEMEQLERDILAVLSIADPY
ncbi:rRNA maturation RNase YbeY ['Osedax' symbiont bacterium Rs2_46_30_T18]|nr:rRNA maturation RNase YbeY ['Osedax' symbiont bacterium Rs2_46_30_T18]